jgi:AcrR family transcriptional regulator
MKGSTMSDSTKFRILGAALSILRKQGADSLTVDAAAELASVSRKTVYNHFGNRYALIDEAAAQWMATTISSLETVAQDESLGFIERLNTVVERGFAEMRAAGMLIRDQQATGATLVQAPLKQNLRRKLRVFIQTMVTQAMDSGLVRQDFDARRLTWVLVNIIEGLLIIDDLDDEPFARFDILRDSLRAVLSGILTEEGADALKHSPIFQ